MRWKYFLYKNRIKTDPFFLFFTVPDNQCDFFYLLNDCDFFYLLNGGNRLTNEKNRIEYLVQFRN